MGELMSEKKGIQIDMLEMGKFFGADRVIRFDACNKLKPKVVRERDAGRCSVNNALMYFGI